MNEHLPASSSKWRVISSMVMPGGWHKPELDRLGRAMPNPIRAGTYGKLIAAVTKFRADNGIMIGDVRADIDNYICSHFPNFCVPGNATVDVHVQFAVDKIRSLTDEMLQWLERIIINHSADRLVLQTEARRRAEICSKCKLNVPWNESCGSCLEAVNRLSSVLRIGNTLSATDRKLKCCKVLHHENRAAVWLRLDYIATSSELPSYCWARRPETTLTNGH
jgi:hypothetical protein